MHEEDSFIFSDVSNDSHPALKGTYTGLAIRDDLQPRAMGFAK